MATTAKGTPYVESSDLVANYPAVSLALAEHIDDFSGKILQVVHFTYGTQITSSSTGYADTGLSASITPSRSDSKVLIFVNHSGPVMTSGSGNNSIAIKLLRNTSTFLADFTLRAGLLGSALDRYGFPITGIYLDSPATTSVTSYRTQFANFNAGSAIYLQFQNEPSTMTLMEVSA